MQPVIGTRRVLSGQREAAGRVVGDAEETRRALEVVEHVDALAADAVGRRSSAKLAGPRYRFVECDLARPAAIAAAVLPALRELAGLQLSAVTLVNNAAVATPLGLAGQLDIAAADEAFATNVTAPLALTDLFLRSFDASLERRVLNISSGAAQTAIAGSAVYCMSKAALD